MNISSQWPRADVRWYLGVRCKKCGVPILFALDRSEGMEGGMPPAAGKLVLTCTLDNCRHQADYTAAAVSRFQKQQQANPNQTGRDNESAKSRKHKR